MPKSQFLDPNELRKSSYIHFDDVPVNQYQKTVSEVREMCIRDRVKDVAHEIMEYNKQFLVKD